MPLSDQSKDRNRASSHTGDGNGNDDGEVDIKESAGVSDKSQSLVTCNLSSLLEIAQTRREGVEL